MDAPRFPRAECSDRIVPFFQEDGYDVTYLEFDGAHEVPREVGSAALDWFLA